MYADFNMNGWWTSLYSFHLAVSTGCHHIHSRLPGAGMWANGEKEKRGSGDFLYSVSLCALGVLSPHPVFPLIREFLQNPLCLWLGAYPWFSRCFESSPGDTGEKNGNFCIASIVFWILDFTYNSTATLYFSESSNNSIHSINVLNFHSLGKKGCNL